MRPIEISQTLDTITGIDFSLENAGLYERWSLGSVSISSCSPGVTEEVAEPCAVLVSVYYRYGSYSITPVACTPVHLLYT